jgi:hypothetical protein
MMVLVRPKNLEVFVVVTVVLSLLLIVVHNRMHTVKILLHVVHV